MTRVLAAGARSRRIVPGAYHSTKSALSIDSNTWALTVAQTRDTSVPYRGRICRAVIGDARAPDRRENPGRPLAA